MNGVKEGKRSMLVVRTKEEKEEGRKKRRKGGKKGGKGCTFVY